MLRHRPLGRIDRLSCMHVGAIICDGLLHMPARSCARILFCVRVCLLLFNYLYPPLRADASCVQRGVVPVQRRTFRPANTETYAPISDAHSVSNHGVWPTAPNHSVQSLIGAESFRPVFYRRRIIPSSLLKHRLCACIRHWVTVGDIY